MDNQRRRRRNKGETMSDSELALRLDTLLWLSPSGSMRDNSETYEAVNGTLDELERANELLYILVERLLPLHPWREHPQLAVPLLEALLFTEAAAGQRVMPDSQDEEP